MLPTLQPGDELLYAPRAYRRQPPQPGDIVIARHPQQPELLIVKRVQSATSNGRYHLLGDNPPQSTDSRHFGPVPRSHILGRVTHKF
jgi:nickel-type superoxide dismutase maturation protease